MCLGRPDEQRIPSASLLDETEKIWVTELETRIQFDRRSALDALDFYFDLELRAGVIVSVHRRAEHRVRPYFSWFESPANRTTYQNMPLIEPEFSRSVIIERLFRLKFWKICRQLQKHN